MMHLGSAVRQGIGAAGTAVDKFRIMGGRPLSGEVRISGAKNAALPIILSSLLTAERLILRNVPHLRDVQTCLRLLEMLGKRVSWPEAGILHIEGAATGCTAPYELVKTMRASILALGPLTAHMGEARVSLPGGCAIGARPVDLHISGLQQMGASIELCEGYIHALAPDGRLHGVRLEMDKVSVTATENLMMAAALASGITSIENAAQEPEVADLAVCLNMMGARITGAGSSTIRVEGVSSLHGGEHCIVPDRIEAGTYLVAAAATQGCITCRQVSPGILEPILSPLTQANALITADEESVRLDMRGRELYPVDIVTAPHPGFPTDMQAQFTVLNVLANGPSRVTETIFENRFMHVPELMRMGAALKIQGNMVLIDGGSRLRGAQVMATDLRASASLVIAGLAASGTTIIDRIYHVDRGYERIEDKIRALGGTIERFRD